jgi:tRNA G18 (ribose-2'-O)-methylase SpoU
MSFSLLGLKKFSSLTLKKQHKYAAFLLKYCLLKDPKYFTHYALLCDWMNLPYVTTLESQHDRFYEHIQQSSIHLPKYIDPLKTKTLDPLPSTPSMPIAVYLDNLRSAYNVGNILRTMEAFRFGSIFMAKNTPKKNHPKVEETSMGASFLIDEITLENLPRPWIALETAQDAIDIYDFTFPEKMTLILGNEALGISHDLLMQADIILKIPLIGSKNSLNVSNAFAITAYEITRQRQLKNKH